MSFVTVPTAPLEENLEDKSNQEVEITTIYSNNPYVLLNQEDPDSNNFTQASNQPLNNTLSSKTIKIANSNLSLLVTDELYIKILKLEKMDCYVKFICLGDFLINLIYFIVGYYYALLLALISMYGYYSTYTHKKSMLCGYLYYQYILSIGKFLQFIFCCFLLNDSFEQQFHELYPFINLPGNIKYLIYYSSILLGCQLYIACYIRKYYYLLPNKQDKHNIYLVHDEALLV